MQGQTSFVAAERERIQDENRRRERELSPYLYAPWQPAENLMHAERKRVAAMMLHRACVFPNEDDQCLEVGCGAIGWLGDMITWGVSETNLHGIDLDPIRVSRAQKILPMADIRVGDATALPWGSNSFDLVIAATVFTSILNQRVRHLVANEIARVIAPDGVLLWYDFAVNNRWNPNVRRVTRKELKQLFPGFRGEIRSVTLVPSIARLVAAKSWVAATLLEAVPLLRTHLLAVLIKTIP
jgi:ubiquinone/menaquinone biosynthesis C-methylase UbiE